MSNKHLPAILREAGSSLSDLDKKALEVHSSLIEEGYESCDSSHTVLKTTRLSDGWKDGGCYCFYYRHPKSAFYFIAKVVEIGGSLVTLMDSGEGSVKQNVTKLGGDDNLSGGIKLLSKEVLSPGNIAKPMSSFPERLPQRGPDVPHYSQPSQGQRIDPLRDYGRGDLFGGTGGGNVIGPNAFNSRQDPRNGFIDPSSGRLFPGHPPGARFDPVGPAAGTPDPDLFYGGGDFPGISGPGNMFGRGNGGSGGGAGGGMGMGGGGGMGMGGLPGMYM